MQLKWSEVFKKSYPCDAKTCPYLKMSVQFVDCEGCELARKIPLPKEECPCPASQSCR
jgi:hypothetical protein